VLSAFAAIALALASIGLYGVVSFAVAQRTREIGIRMAIGAQRSNVLRMVMRQGLRLSLIGVATGLIAGFGADYAMNTILQNSEIDWRVYFVVAPLLLAVTLLAAYVPARRASRVDPMRALRYE
jgi:putative ABC transport system permease protein